MRGARKLMRASTYDATRAAHDILMATAGGAVHVVVPKQYAVLWRLKRYFPRWFLNWLPKQRGRK